MPRKSIQKKIKIVATIKNKSNSNRDRIIRTMIYIYIYIHTHDAPHWLDLFLESGDIPICSPIYTVRGHVGIAMYPFSSIKRDMCVFQ